ncbi:MAG TPA: hypothetical protein H9979_04115 [Candidatus Megamonas gallistercoris]|nr:hypothetical protein [Candidatus Megamonas gallistercoris]
MKYESTALLKSITSITEGTVVGVADDIIIDGAGKKVIALGLARKTPEKYYYPTEELKVIPFQKIIGINDTNIMIMSSKDIISYRELKPDFIDKILQDKIKVVDTDCIKNGERYGKVKEYTINENGDILSCKVAYYCEEDIDIQNIDILAKDYTIVKVNDMDNTKEPVKKFESEQVKIKTETVASPVKKANHDLSMSYKLYLNKTLKKDISCNGKTYSSGTTVTKQLIDELAAANKVNILGETVNC